MARKRRGKKPAKSRNTAGGGKRIQRQVIEQLLRGSVKSARELDGLLKGLFELSEKNASLRLT